jgi:hypothetical protein
MEQKAIWVIFFFVLTLLGLGVALFPQQVGRLIGAPPEIKVKRRLVWRGLGLFVLIVAVIELVMIFVVGHIVR